MTQTLMTREPPALAETSVVAEPSRHHLRILVIEDNRDAADSLRMFLQLLGHEVSVAYNGTEGVAQVHALQPHVILSDIGLPGLNGWEVAQAVRRDPATADVTLIAVTGYGSDEDKRHARQVGYDYLLTKPADPEALLRLLSMN